MVLIKQQHARFLSIPETIWQDDKLCKDLLSPAHVVSLQPKQTWLSMCPEKICPRVWYAGVACVLSISACFKRRETLRESVDQAWVCECPQKLAVKILQVICFNYRGFAWRLNSSRLFHALTQNFTAFEVS